MKLLGVIWSSLVPFTGGAGFIHQLLVVGDTEDAMLILFAMLAWVFFDWLDAKAEGRGK